VGPSGAGKTTLVDLVLGILKPTNGSVTISGMPPEEVVRKWPGAIGYVPQDVVIMNGTIRDNVSMGFAWNESLEELVWDALELAQLREVVERMPKGLETEVGSRGVKLSGGQRQRLGIARALFTKPALLALDEATSALDGQTESEFTSAINALKGKVTVIVIAHRLSTVKEADYLVYLENGRVLGKGSFENLRKCVKEFDEQALLMGF
jgi:ABC-type multidrug transport system fused ATPase/permease subunit